jgi:hypothetical protein
MCTGPLPYLPLPPPAANPCPPCTRNPSAHSSCPPPSYPPPSPFLTSSAVMGGVCTATELLSLVRREPGGMKREKWPMK